MRILGLNITRSARAEPLQESKGQAEDVLMRLIAAREGSLDGIVTPENCMASPTVHAIVTAISRRMVCQWGRSR